MDLSEINWPHRPPPPPVHVATPPTRSVLLIFLEGFFWLLVSFGLARATDSPTGGFYFVGGLLGVAICGVWRDLQTRRLGSPTAGEGCARAAVIALAVVLGIFVAIRTSEDEQARAAGARQMEAAGFPAKARP